jgi:hypothetical protein
MKSRIPLLIVFSILFGIGALLRFCDAGFLNQIFMPDTGRELLRYVYADSLMLGGICLLLAVIFNDRIKKPWQEWLMSRRVLMGLLGLAYLWIRVLYLARSWSLAGDLGFPIDDAWIHAVYARNFANDLVLGFLPGTPDSGCSAPLWPIILALGVKLGIGALWNGYVWANILWAGSLFAVYLLAKRLLHDFHRIWLILLAIAVQPMLIWSSLSGLETGLFVLVVYSALYFYTGSEKMKWLGAVIAGLGGVVRAEGWILIGAIFLVDVFRKKVTFGNALGRLGLSILIVLPWIAHNYMTIGNILPQTFYAKSSAFSLGTVWWTMQETAVFAISPGMWAWTFLLPLAIWGWIKLRDGFLFILPLVITFLLYWCAVASSVGFFWTYYRYLHPFIPFIILFIVIGVYRLFEQKIIIANWLLGGAAVFTVAAGVFASTIYGYGVENIEDQQVAMAVWTRDNVPAGETVAANDVGAMGYFSEHRIFDLIGLVGESVRLRHNATWEDLAVRDIHWAVIYPSWIPMVSSDPLAVPVAEFVLERTVTAGSNRVVVYHKE